MYANHAFAVVGATVCNFWNSLGSNLRVSDLNITSFGRLLQTRLFLQCSVH